MTSTLIIIPAAYRDPVNAAVAQQAAVFPDQRPEGEFHVGLYLASNVEQATPDFYCLCDRFTPAKRAVVEAMKAQFPDALVFDYDFKNDPGFPATTFAQLGLKTKTPPAGEV
jgi:hypothetical protein